MPTKPSRPSPLDTNFADPIVARELIDGDDALNDARPVSRPSSVDASSIPQPQRSPSMTGAADRGERPPFKNLRMKPLLLRFGAIPIEQIRERDVVRARDGYERREGNVRFSCFESNHVDGMHSDPLRGDFLGESALTAEATQRSPEHACLPSRNRDETATLTHFGTSVRVRLGFAGACRHALPGMGSSV